AMGLRADVEWILQVDADPTSQRYWGFPMLPSEEASIAPRQSGIQPYVGLVNRYASDHEAEFGGLYLDNLHDRIATLWTGNLDVHLARILPLDRPHTTLVV